MISKPKLALMAAFALAGIASPALAQTSMDNGWATPQQERSYRSGHVYNYAPADPRGTNLYDGNQGNPAGGAYPGDY